MKWDTNKLLNQLQSLGLKAKVTGPGGDYDTDCIIVRGKGHYRIYARGFLQRDDGETIDNPAQPTMDVPHVEITDGEDSRGGCNSNRAEDIQLYADVRKVFAAYGVDVINHCDEIF